MPLSPSRNEATLLETSNQREPTSGLRLHHRSTPVYPSAFQSCQPTPNPNTTALLAKPGLKSTT